MNTSVMVATDDVTNTSALARAAVHLLREAVTSGNFLPAWTPVSIEFYGGKLTLQEYKDFRLILVSSNM